MTVAVTVAVTCCSVTLARLKDRKIAGSDGVPEGSFCSVGLFIEQTKHVCAGWNEGMETTAVRGVSEITSRAWKLNHGDERVGWCRCMKMC